MRRILAGILPALVLAAGCAAVTPAAAVVNGQKVSEREVQEEVDRVRRDPRFVELLKQQGDEVRGQARRNILSNYIRVLVEQQQVRKMRIPITSAKVSTFLSRLKQQLGGETAFRQILKENFLTEKQARVLAERQLYEEELTKAVTRDLKVDEAKVQQFYEQNRTAFTEVHLQSVAAPSAEAARRIAEDPKTTTWNDMGYLDLSAVDPGLRAQLEPVPVGGIAGPVQRAAGFEAYKLLDRRPTPLDKVRTKITDQLLQQDRKREFDGWLQEVMRRTRIVINPKYGRFDRATLTVVPGATKLPE